MGPVHIGVGHDDNLVIAQFFDIEIIPANTRAHSRDQSADFRR